MSDVSRSGSAIVMPTNQFATQDYEAGKFTLTNGTVSVNVTTVGGASGYAEGTTVGTATGNVIIFRGTGGTTIAVGTANPLPVTVLSNVASGYAEGTTIGTITAPALIYRGIGGTTTAVGTANPLPVTLATLLAGEDLTNNRMMTSPRYNYTHIVAGLGTTIVKGTASGLLHSVTLNSAASATNVTTIFDSVAGTAGGTAIAIPAATTATVPSTLTYDVAFTNGLVIEAKTAAGSDLTISWL